MANITDLALSDRLFLRGYRWRRNDPLPWSPPRKTLAESRVALVSTAGLIAPGQTPFDSSKRGGDASYRELPSDADVRTLTENHRSKSFDHRGVEADPNLGLPLDRLRELAEEGIVGSVNHRHFSLMGSITLTAPLVEESAPAVAAALAADGVDVALLVPV